MANYVVQILSGISSGAILFLVASGLTLIFGALRIANFAHGSLYMLGAFLMLSIGGHVGFSNGSFWLSMVLAALAVAGIGTVMEVLVLRPVYGRANLTQLIVTFALVLMVGGIVRGIYGSTPRSTETPPALAGGVDILGRNYPKYQLLLIGLAVLVALSLWGLLYLTPLRAHDPGCRQRPGSARDVQPQRASPVHGRLHDRRLLRGLAGAAVASQGAVATGMDIDVIIRAFVIVVIGGLGSLTGALVGSLLVGIAESLGILNTGRVARDGLRGAGARAGRCSRRASSDGLREGGPPGRPERAAAAAPTGSRRSRPSGAGR